MVHGPAAGLTVLDPVDERLAGHQRLDAVRARLSEMAGETEAALAAYRIAVRRTTNVPERDYLTARAARLRVSDHAHTLAGDDAS